MSTRDLHSKRPGTRGSGDAPRHACPDGDVLVTFLYDEFEPGATPDREQIALHLRECQSCASELEALGGVRSQLTAWVTPELASSFRLVAEPVSRSWWRQAFAWDSGWLRPAIPLGAAALVAGIALGVARLEVTYGADGLRVRTGWGAASGPANAGALDQTRVMRAEIESLRQELRKAQSLMGAGSGLVAASALTPAAAVPASAPSAADSEAAQMRRLRRLIDESEMRQQQNLQLRISEVARDFRLMRQADLVQVEQGFSRLAGQRQLDAAQQQRLLDALRNVSVQGRQPQ